MNSRMEKHYGLESLERSKKNKELYESIYDTDILSEANVKLQDNEKVIDMKKVNEMVQNREDYLKQKKYKEAMSLEEEEEEPTQYDIYEDIESRIFDINMILENARKQRNAQPNMKKRLRNTQYDILNKLNLGEVAEEQEEEDQAFFSKEGDIDDLFHQLKGNENTVVTKPIKEEKEYKKENDTFYTNVMAFTKDDFDELKDLKKTVKRNNRLIKVLTTILVLALLAIVGVVAYNMFFK